MKRLDGALVAALVTSWSPPVHAQACCAAAGALTPGRLAVQDNALAGLQVRAASLIGSFDPAGRYAGSPPRTSEYDLEQDLFGAIRVLRRGQIALLVPFVETSRSTPTASELGGGIGDVNASLRYDFYLAGRSQYLPGVAVLGGTTIPTGTPPESATSPLATDATGVGVFQGNVGLAIEQTYGAWLVNLTGLVAKRLPRSVRGVDEELGTQLTGLVGVAYTFDNHAVLALFASYAYEGNATIAGVEQPSSARSTTLVTISGVVPIADPWRLQAGAFVNPPIRDLGENQPATAGLSTTIVRSWW